MFGVTVKFLRMILLDGVSYISSCVIGMQFWAHLWRLISYVALCNRQEHWIVLTYGMY